VANAVWAHSVGALVNVAAFGERLRGKHDHNQKFNILLEDRPRSGAATKLGPASAITSPRDERQHGARDYRSSVGDRCCVGRNLENAVRHRGMQLA
jgi:hypothetical protein